ncbi:MAG: acyltransferase [Hyphomicrobiales bacterium]|nr:acyltransferase [Hyphomicrobiales bacterium]
MIGNLQVICAFAALNVVLLHSLFTANSYELPTRLFAALNKSEWGNSGVDLFFVISGFVMIYTQWQKPKSANEFFKNRVIRIVPLYWALTLLFATIFIVMPAAFRDTSITITHYVSSLLFVSNIVADKNPLLFMGWTLEYEMLFYAIFSVGILFPSKSAKFLFPVVFLVLLPLVTRIDFIVLESIFGMCAAVIFLKVPQIKFALPVFLASVIVLGIDVFAETQLHRALKWGVPSFFVVLSACYLPQLKNRALIMLGDASYSIYLIQVFTIVIFYKLTRWVPDFVPNDLIIVACVTFTANAGIVLFYIFEMPLVKLTKNMWGPAQYKTVAAE